MTAEEPKVSKDGKFYWDGTAWQPMPQADRRMPGQVLPTPVLMVLVALATIAVLLFVLFEFAA
jgi:hypothetical protein